LTKFEEIHYCKRRKVYSNQKQFHIYNILINDKGRQNAFNLYYDKDIGFSPEWQGKLKSTTMDDDQMTDDEQHNLAYHHILEELEEGISTFKQFCNEHKKYKF
jgi:hypothetical protein